MSELEKIRVYKRTIDDWYPSYRIETMATTPRLIVEVSFLEFPNNAGWRVCAWGGDDCGLEKDFKREQRDAAWATFVEVISQKTVEKWWLKDKGFWPA